MNPEWKTKWLTALRSGEYEQTTGVLRNEDGFCCLGVLCDIHDADQWSENNYRDDSGGFDRIGMPPDFVMASVALDDWNASRLTDMNDSGSTFAEIADYIEATL